MDWLHSNPAISPNTGIACPFLRRFGVLSFGNAHRTASGTTDMVVTNTHDGKPVRTDYLEVPTALIDYSPFNPRKNFDENEIILFGLSLREHGIKVPIRVYPHDGRYRLIGGERRLRACRAVGIPTIPALVEEAPADEQSFLVDQLSENDNRQSLSFAERGDAYQRLLKLNGWTAVQVAKALRVHPSEISRTLSVKNLLAPELRPHVESGALPVSVAYEIVKKCRSPPRQVELAERVMRDGLSRAELIALLRAERTAGSSRARSKPLRLVRSFPTDGGYEPIKQSLTALLAEVQRAERNNLPVGLLAEFWDKKT
jgi:ParB family transcriptional regulator, chromosome partitioning protein